MPKPLHNVQYSKLTGLLRAAREEQGLTQWDLAEALGEDQSFVSKCERGIRRLDIVEVRNWVRAMGLSFHAFAKHLDSELEQTAALESHALKRSQS